MHAAVTLRNADSVTALIKSGANVNIINKDGLTPLDVATQSDHEEIVVLLREAGAESRSSLAKHD